MAPPALIPFGGDWPPYEAVIYDRYYSDLIGQKVFVRGRLVKVRWNPLSKGKPFNFWHLISEGEHEDDRTPDLRRCERIGWIKWVLECFDQGDISVKWWLSDRQTKHGRKTNIVIWVEAHDYVVIIDPRPGYALLVSAYLVEPRRAVKLAKEYESFASAPRPIPNW